jgi:predicted nucleotidyltransferase component of viral defense system
VVTKIVDAIYNKSGINQRDLIEKDLTLHKLLLELSSNPYFKENYAFKGGTCLIKCYLGYYRFSEDLDFTFKNKGIFENKSEKQIRKIVSKEIDKLAKLLDKICRKLNLEFKPEKSNKEYFEFRAGNKFTTIKMYYHSPELNKKTFIKLQINFLEDLIFECKNKKANSLRWKDYNETELKFILPEGSDWFFQSPEISCYDLKEILCEKIRAILTRQGVKSRDFIDVYLITKNQGLSLKALKKEVVKKIISMLKYEKYLDNLKGHMQEIPAFKIGEEEKLLIGKLDKDFHKFLEKFNEFLKEIMTEIENEH